MTTTINASTTAGLVQTADTSGVLALQTAGTTAVTVDASQNVGIGTASPRAKVDVNGSIYTGWADTNFIGMQFGSDPSGYRLGLLPVSSTRDLQIQAKSSDGFSVSGITFYTGTGPTERMRIDSSGRVGINATPSTSTTAQLQVTGGNTNATTLATAYSTATAVFVPKSSSGYSLQFGSGPSDVPYIQMSAGGSAAGDLTIQPYGGNLQVGNTGAISTERFTVASGSNTLAAWIQQSTNTSGYNVMVLGLGSNGGNTSTSFIRGNTNAVGNWYLYGNGTTSFTSDQRLKKNIESTRDGYLEDLAKLRVVKYNWRKDDDGTPKELGLIAQEVEQVFPGLVQDDPSRVSEDDPTVYKTLKQSVIPFMLLKAIQEQQALITQLQADVAALKGATP
jgi:hypothetical protein